MSEADVRTADDANADGVDCADPADAPDPQPIRRVHFRDPAAPSATVVVPSVFVSIRNDRGEVLLVRRCDSGTWELPGGRVEVGESALGAALRETAEETGLRVLITGLVGLFTDPSHIVESAGRDETRQQFVVCFHGWSTWGRPHADQDEVCDAVWFDPADVELLPVEPGMRRLVRHALSGAEEPHID